MSKSLVNVDTIEQFARNALCTEACPPDDFFQFALYECLKCGGPALMLLTLEHHTGSADSDFKGRITGQCGICDESRALLSCTGSTLNPATGQLEARTPLRQDRPHCECGNPAFAVASCLYFEEADFFDDGVVVGQCPQWGKCRVFVQLD